MQKTSQIFCLAMLFLCRLAYADTSNSSPGGSSINSSELATTAQAGNSANNQNINFNSGSPLGKSTLVTTGSANLGGFSGSFSSDYCGSTAQAAVGGLGFGLSGGMAKIDHTCVMLRTFERTQQAASALMQIDPAGSEKLRRASIAILAEIDPQIKLIYQKHGLLDDNGIGLVGKLLEVNSNTKVSSDIKTNNEQQAESIPNATPKVSSSQSQTKPINDLRMQTIPNVNYKISSTHGQAKPNNELQVETIPLAVMQVTASSESSDNPIPQSFWDRFINCIKSKF